MSATQVMSQLTFLDKYSRFIWEKGRRESWEETVKRVADFLSKSAGGLKQEDYDLIYDAIFKMEVGPSMRLMSTAGIAADLNNASIYNCFARETEFVTEHGVKSFFDFDDGDYVVVKTHDGSWRSAIVKNFGVQKLNKITFRRLRSEKIVRATKDHEWILSNGTRTRNLSVGDSIVSVPDEICDWSFDNATPNEKIAWCYGYVYGDGVVNNKHSMVRLCGEQNKFVDRFIGCGFGSSQPMSIVGDTIVYTGKYLKTTPELALKNLDEIRAFVVGYLDADGAKSHSETNKNKYLSIQSSQQDHIDFIESAFEMVGVYILNKRDLTGQETNFGIRPTTTHFGLTHNIGHTNTKWSVKSIEEDVEEEVWCLIVDEKHSFVLSGGIATGNCSYLPLESAQDFHDLTLLLGLGVGVGFSVEKHFVDSFGMVREATGNTYTYKIGDDIYSWAQSVKFLVEHAMNGDNVAFDYSLIRPAGSPLKTRGGRASGPAPLVDAHGKIQELLSSRRGMKLTTIDAFDIACHIAGAIVSGGVRRSAMIAIFDKDDKLMLDAKSYGWWEENLQRQYANISVVIDEYLFEEDVDALLQRQHDSKSGEPGIFSRYAVRASMPKRRKLVANMGGNPCMEIILRPRQFCNLSQAILREDDTEETVREKIRIAAIIGTIQSSLTHFPGLHPDFKKNAEEERLLGVSLSGISDCRVIDNPEFLEELKQIVNDTNAVWAKKLKIKKSASTTCIKPDGNTSVLYNTSPGLHPRFSKYYIRRFRLQYKNPVAQWLLSQGVPAEPVLGESWENVRTVVFSFPIASPKSVTRFQDEVGAIEQLETWLRIKQNYTEHNPSVTIHYKPEELDSIKKFVFENQEWLSGVSFLDNGHTYEQAPYEAIDEEVYDKLVSEFPSIDFDAFWQFETNFDSTSGAQTLACVGGACLI